MRPRRTYAGLWSMLCLILASACTILGSEQRTERLLARLGAAAGAAGPFMVEGRVEADDDRAGSFRFAADAHGRWRWDELDGRWCAGWDGNRVWAARDGEPARRLGFSLADALVARAWAWSGGSLLPPHYVVHAPADGVLALRRDGVNGGARLELGADARPLRVRPYEGQALVMGDWKSVEGGAFAFSLAQEPHGVRWIAERFARVAAEIAPPPDRHGDVHIDPDLAQRVPLRRTAGGCWLVQGYDAGELLGWFLLDTGAGPTCIDRALAERLALAPAGQSEVVTLGGQVRGALHQGRPLRIGPLTLPAHPWIALDLGPLSLAAGEALAGILGAELFLRAHVEVGPHARELLLARPRPAPPGAMHVVFDGRIPCCEAILEGRRAWLRLDTGATDTLILHAPFVREHDLLAEPRSTRSVTLRGLGGKRHVERGSLRNGSLCGVSLAGVEASFALAREGPLAVRDPQGIVGMGLLGHRRLVLDLGSGWWSWPAR